MSPEMATTTAGNIDGEEQDRPRLLLVDDERGLIIVLAEILEEYGFTVVSACEGEDAVKIAVLYEPDVLLTDYELPGIDGVTTARRIREECSDVRVVLMSGNLSRSARHRAEEAAVDSILQKPLLIPELLDRLEGLRRGRSAGR